MSTSVITLAYPPTNIGFENVTAVGIIRQAVTWANDPRNGTDYLYSVSVTPPNSSQRNFSNISPTDLLRSYTQNQPASLYGFVPAQEFFTGGGAYSLDFVANVANNSNILYTTNNLSKFSSFQLG